MDVESGRAVLCDEGGCSAEVTGGETFSREG